MCPNGVPKGDPRTVQYVLRSRPRNEASQQDHPFWLVWFSWSKVSRPKGFLHQQRGTETRSVRSDDDSTDVLCNKDIDRLQCRLSFLRAEFVSCGTQTNKRN